MDHRPSPLSLLPPDLREATLTGVPLRELTTLRIGGPADLVCPARNPDDAKRFQAFAADRGLPFFVLGGGSNLLGADEGCGGVVLRVATTGFAVRGDTVRAGAGLDFDDLIARTLGAGLTGLEFASGIPGTLGGALVGNAGCYGHEIGEFLVEALVLRPDGRLETVGPEAFGFAYRATALRETRTIVLEALLRLGRGDPAAAGAQRAGHIADRRRKHPVDLPSAGSWFRNLPPAEPGGRRQPAGVLLEQAGAKAMREGDAAVFAKHANIVVNLGRATSADVRRLVERMRAAVRERFGVELVEEVRQLGP
ncbi:MAG: UDP-N-acetylmuramate dehydrogenase [Krumholzibacteria bacterium]|nr:UDP-N-acetylmuramate dehydrogenase [Candidatus Krumholzibacteria bacterium]